MSVLTRRSRKASLLPNFPILGNIHFGGYEAPEPTKTPAVKFKKNTAIQQIRKCSGLTKNQNNKCAKLFRKSISVVAFAKLVQCWDQVRPESISKFFESPKSIKAFLPLDEVIASRAVFVIVAGRTGGNAFGPS